MSRGVTTLCYFIKKNHIFYKIQTPTDFAPKHSYFKVIKVLAVGKKFEKYESKKKYSVLKKPVNYKFCNSKIYHHRFSIFGYVLDLTSMQNI